jgi:dipeptidyl aminopeptidase/acylaminoacyl peptidase
MSRFVVSALAALALLCLGSGAIARPFTVDDMLHQASLGAVAIDPSGRWLVLEQRDHFDTASRYDYNLSTSLSLSRLKVLDLRRPGAPRPLLAKDAGPGIVMAGFSPSGARLAVYRLHDRQWTVGVVTVATRTVRWFKITPQDQGRGRSVQWISDRELLLIQRTDRLAPENQHSGWIIADRLPRYIAAATRGEGAHTVYGSGAFASLRRRAPPNRLVRINVVSGAQQVLTAGELIDLEVSPDHKKVALLEAGADVQPRKGGPVRGPAGLETESSGLSVLDLGTLQRRGLCDGCDVLPQLLSWSPSGASLLVFARGADGLWTTGQLLKIDASTAAKTTLALDLQVHMDLNPASVWTAWMGEDPLVFARAAAAPGARDDWFRVAPDGSINLTRDLPAPNRLVRIATPTSLTVLTADGLWRVESDGRSGRLPAEQPRPAEAPPRALTGGRLDRSERGSFWLTAGPQGQRVLGKVDAGGFHAPFKAPAGGELKVASLGAGAAVFRNLDDHGVESLRLVRAAAGEREVVRINPELAETGALRVEPVHHRGPEGQALVSWLFLPAGACGGGDRPPLVILPYLGTNHPTAPRDNYMEIGFFQNLRVLTGHGYALLVPSLPEPSGGLTEPASGLANRILDIVDAAAADHTLAECWDPSRLALLGWSFGGYTTMTAITQSNRFRAAIAMDGISDLTAYWASLGLSHQITPEVRYMSNWSTGNIEQSQPTLLAPPWVDPDRYRRNSPIYAADRIETPLMLVHGWEDALPIAQSEAMYSALFRQDKDALLVTYWGGKHGLISPGDVRDLYQRTFEFLDKYLARGSSAAPTPTGAPSTPSPRPGPEARSSNPASGSASTAPRLRP